MPTPAAPAVLCTPDSIKPGQKGGTLIAESVCNAKEHRRLLESGGYRPEGCPHCGGFLHILGPRATGPLGLDDVRADLPARNPFTGEEIRIAAKPARRVDRVRPLKALKDMAES